MCAKLLSTAKSTKCLSRSKLSRRQPLPPPPPPPPLPPPPNALLVLELSILPLASREDVVVDWDGHLVVVVVVVVVVVKVVVVVVAAKMLRAMIYRDRALCTCLDLFCVTPRP